MTLSLLVLSAPLLVVTWRRHFTHLPPEGSSGMPAAELRTDIWTGRQVIVAGGRADRPQTVAVSNLESSEESRNAAEAKLDPFLEGREVDTPSESLALRRKGTALNEMGWLLRIVANRYPAVASMTDANPNAAKGIHDVVIECPDFRRCWQQFSVPEVARVLTAWQFRQQQLESRPEVRSIQIFRNQGAAAGASLGHSHSQIISLNTVPKLIEQRLQNADGFQNWRATEIADGRRVVVADDLLVICPDASWVAGQVRICPPAIKSKSMSGVPFHKLPADAILNLASVLQQCARVVKTTFSGASFNVVLNQPPMEHVDAFPWSIDMMPRTASFAGFELACDIPIITTSPESAAASYRAAWTKRSSATEAPNIGICPPDYRWLTSSVVE